MLFEENYMTEKFEKVQECLNIEHKLILEIHYIFMLCENTEESP